MNFQNLTIIKETIKSKRNLFIFEVTFGLIIVGVLIFGGTFK